MLLLVRELTDVAASVAAVVGGDGGFVVALFQSPCVGGGGGVAVADQATYLRVGGRSSWMMAFVVANEKSGVAIMDQMSATKSFVLVINSGPRQD